MALAIGPVCRGVGTALMVELDGAGLGDGLTEAAERGAGLAIGNVSFLCSVSGREITELTAESMLDERW